MPSDFRAVFMPYCLKKQADGRYAVLNRNHKPVGFFTGDFVKYEAHPVVVRINEIDPSMAASVSWNGSEDTGEIFLYSDGCLPASSAENMQAYLARLEKLAPLKIS